jgi:ferredoxin/protein involved in ribonucleotide reduction
MENKNLIYCYSGTGNSLASAKQLADEIGAEVISITKELVLSKSSINCDVFVLIFPVYGYGVPKTVRDFIKNSAFKANHFAVVGTNGGQPAGGFAEAIRFFKKRKISVNYFAGIECVENFVHMYELPSDENLVEICKRQSEKTQVIANDIKERKQNKDRLFRPVSRIVSFAFKRATGYFAKKYKLTDACNGCGVCHRVCPANAIKMVDNKPSINKKQCDSCQACLQLCPQKALKFGKITPQGRRYKHFDVELKELFKR